MNELITTRKRPQGVVEWAKELVSIRRVFSIYCHKLARLSHEIIKGPSTKRPEETECLLVAGLFLFQ